jgi:hypothetical protein
MYQAPRVVSHIFHAGRGPFRNICELADDDALLIIADMSASGRPKLTPEYLHRRRMTEDWLLQQAGALFGRAPDNRPLYGFLGDFGHAIDPSRPCTMRLDLETLGAVSFTLGDSMSVSTGPEPRLLDRAGLDALFATGDVGNFDFSDAGGSARNFIEVQIWEREGLPTPIPHMMSPL